MRVAELLVQLGARVVAADTHVDPRTVPRDVELVELTAHELSLADLVILLTEHDDVTEPLALARGVRILDTRRALPQREGVDYR